MMAWLAREQENIVCERNKTQQFRADMLKQKQEWSDAIEIKQAQLNQMTEEKREELSIMEIAIRR